MIAAGTLLQPNLVVLPNAAMAAQKVVEHFIAQLHSQPTSILGLATGRTQEPVYASLCEAFLGGRISFASAASFNLDEYVGLPNHHPSSFAAYMRLHLFGKVDLPKTRQRIPRGDAAEPEREAKDYESAIAAAGGIDLMLLGIGRNGHIGFNEPGASFGSRTRVVRLSEATRRANTCEFPPSETPPANAITMGIATILEAREIVLLATGAAKADAVRAALVEPPAPICPASALRRHARVTFVCDAAAAAGLAFETGHASATKENT